MHAILVDTTQAERPLVWAETADPAVGPGDEGRGVGPRRVGLQRGQPGQDAEGRVPRDLAELGLRLGSEDGAAAGVGIGVVPGAGSGTDGGSSPMDRRAGFARLLCGAGSAGP